MHYSPHVELSSNYDDYDPEKILQKFERNKLVHMSYNIIWTDQSSRTLKHAATVIEKMQTQRAEAGAKMKKLM